jgi:PAS domain S-box-containing protein
MKRTDQNKVTKIPVNIDNLEDVIRQEAERKSHEIKETHLERNLKESENKFKTIFDYSPIGMALTDGNGRFINVNQTFCNLTGFSEAELLSLKYTDITHPEDIEVSRDLIKKVLNEEIRQFDLKKKYIRKNGNILWARVMVKPIYSDKGEFRYIIAQIQDITEQVKNEEELKSQKAKAEKSDRFKMSLMANMSHELRTPMSGILGFTEILSGDLKDEKHKSILEYMNISARRLHNTLNAVLTLAQLDSGDIKFNNNNINIVNQVKSVFDSLKNFVNFRNLEFELISSEPVIMVNIEEAILEQIIMKIIDNAIKFTHKGRITVEIFSKLENKRNWAVLKVKDTGIGIDKKHFNLIFEEFKQLSEGYTRKYEGLGLGLTISKKIVELLGGKIVIDSKPGEGSTFYVYFPEVALEKGLNETIPENKLNGKISIETTDRKNLPNILVVEDNFTNSNLMELVLKEMSNIDVAYDGYSALKMAKNKKYDEVLVDVGLGTGMNGIKVLQELRKLTEYQNTPIITITGFAMIEDKNNLLKQGFDDYIAKPYTIKELRRVVTKYLQKKK